MFEFLSQTIDSVSSMFGASDAKAARQAAPVASANAPALGGLAGGDVAQPAQAAPAQASPFAAFFGAAPAVNANTQIEAGPQGFVLPATDPGAAPAVDQAAAQQTASTLFKAM